MATLAGLNQNDLECFDLTNNLILTRKAENAIHIIDAMGKHISPYNYIAHIAIPNYINAFKITAYNQTMVNEAQIACALERYHLAPANIPKHSTRSRRSLSKQFRTTSSAASRCTTAARQVVNSCSIPLAGMKKTMAEWIRHNSKAEDLSSKAIGSGLCPSPSNAADLQILLTENSGIP